MELFGIPLPTIYLYVLIFSGALTLLYLFFGDMIEGIFEGIDFLNPVLIFSFLTIFSASGFLFESFTSIHSIVVAIISAIISFIFVTLLNVFVLIPLSKAEESLVYREEDLKGRIGTVITAIPVDGFGEVLIESISGRVAKPAASFDDEAIANGKKVLVIDVVDGILHVILYEESEYSI